MSNLYENKLIDIHAHILPAVDDGARTMEESLELVKKAIDEGFCAIIATPHYSRRRCTDGFIEIINAFRSEVQKRYPGFQIYFGQETYYHEGLMENLKSGRAYTMEGSRYVLVEFEPCIGIHTMNRAIRNMNQYGYIPILAHVERYHCLRKKENLNDVCRSGCLLQMNYESISKSWICSETRWCRKMIKNGNIHFLGTDMHRMDFREPSVSKALKWLKHNIESDVFDAITYKNAKCVINNKELGWIKNE